MKSAWTAVWIILIGLGMASAGAYLVYKYRLRVSYIRHLNVTYKCSLASSSLKFNFSSILYVPCFIDWDLKVS